MNSTEYRETVIPTGDSGPFGILTSPVDNQRETGVIILNSGLLHRVGPSRLCVDLCRGLAKLGFVAARIDVSGKGDTPRRRSVEAMDSLLLDFDLCAQALQQKASISRFIVIGLCSGADDAFLIASQRESVSGMVMLDGYAARTWRYYLRNYLPKLFSINLWIRIPGRLIGGLVQLLRSEKVDEKLLRMEDIRIFPPVNVARTGFESMSTHLESCLCVYTSAAQSYYNYEGQLQEKFASFAPSRGVQEEYFPSAKHTYPLAQHRKWVIDTICEWSGSFD